MFVRSLTAVVVMLLLAAGPVRAADTILVPPVNSPWPGKIFVSHDEWLFADRSLTVSPDSGRLALSIAAWFTGGRPGRFLAYSTNFGLTEPGLAALMAEAGHTWTVSTDVEFTLATLLQYDGVFLTGTAVDLSVLTDYVRAGGRVFVAGGTGWGGPVEEAARWNPFLSHFGLAFDPEYNLTRAEGVWPLTSASPLFKDVAALYERFGSPVRTLAANDPYAKVLVAQGGRGMFATYEATVIPVAVEICPNRLDPDSGEKVTATVVSTPDFDARKVDPASVRVVEVSRRSSTLSYGVKASPGRRLAKTAASSCQKGSDYVYDLLVYYDADDLLRSAGQLLGQPLRDGDIVAFTLTGRLKSQYGGTPVVGESVIVIRESSGSGGLIDGLLGTLGGLL